MGLGENGDGLTKNKEKRLRHRQQYGGFQRERRVGAAEEGIGRVNGGGRRLDLGW